MAVIHRLNPNESALQAAPQGVMHIGVWALLAAVALLSSCSDTSTSTVVLNQVNGLELSPPEFLQARAINRSNLTPRVTVVTDSVNYEARHTNVGTSPWVGQVYVPEGSNPVVSVMWVETGVPGLPAEFNAELPLAIYTTSVDNVTLNQVLEISSNQYVTRSTDDLPLPQLDIDADGASNIEERQAGSRPGDAQDVPSSVTILYNSRAPIIDGLYDSLWNTAQFRDQRSAQLSIDNVLVYSGAVDSAISSEFKWAAMHDGTYLYVLVLSESGADQTPFGDSDELIYNDDSVDIYWDGNNSKGSRYDGVDDYHLIVGLLDGEGAANRFSSDKVRVQLGDNSAPLDFDAVQFAVCLCNGEQQAYEFRFELDKVGIPVDTTFGFEVNINNDVNGAERDAKWAWFNDTGIDDTWRFPLRMGNVRLEPLPSQN